MYISNMWRITRNPSLYSLFMIDSATPLVDSIARSLNLQRRKPVWLSLCTRAHERWENATGRHFFLLDDPLEKEFFPAIFSFFVPFSFLRAQNTLLMRLKEKFEEDMSGSRTHKFQKERAFSFFQYPTILWSHQIYLIILKSEIFLQLNA